MDKPSYCFTVLLIKLFFTTRLGFIILFLESKDLCEIFVFEIEGGSTFLPTDFFKEEGSWCKE